MPTSDSVKTPASAVKGRWLLLGVVATALFALLYFAALAVGQDSGTNEPTGHSFLDFLFQIAPGVNLALLAIFGQSLRRNNKVTEETHQNVQEIHHSAVRIVTDETGTARAIQETDISGEAVDAEGRKWVLVEKREGGRRRYERE